MRWPKKPNLALLDLADFLIFLGLGSLGTGLWWFRPWVSLTVLGALLLILGLLGSMGRK